MRTATHSTIGTLALSAVLALAVGSGEDWPPVAPETTGTSSAASGEDWPPFAP